MCESPLERGGGVCLCTRNETRCQRASHRAPSREGNKNRVCKLLIISIEISVIARYEAIPYMLSPT
jgi:hypothetical protein